MEIWKDIEGFEGKYQVSNYGNVRNKKKLLKPSIKTYKEVTLCKDGKLFFHRIHRLVAEAFIDNPNGLPVVHHKDEVKHNNHYENLEWKTNADNISASMSTLKKFKSPDGEIVEVMNFNAFCKENNLDRGNLLKVLKGQIKSSKGWTSA